MSSKSSKYGSGSGGGDDPFKNTTPSSMSKKLKEPKKKRGDSKKQEEQQNSRRRAQNRQSQRAYRERREQRLMELESQVQEAEALNQTLTSAYQELRAEIDRIEVEKAQEQYSEGFATGADPSFDPLYTTSSSNLAGYGQESTAWGDNSWETPEWDNGDYHNYQG